MRILSAFICIGLLAFSVVYGPLLHEHPAGELDGRNAVIHAHFPEREHLESTSNGPSLGYRHSHEKAVWLDAFTTITSSSIHLAAVVDAIFVSPDFEPAPDQVIWVEMPRAHSPPSLDSNVPRSPPA